MNGLLIGLVGLVLLGVVAKKVLNYVLERRALAEFYRRVAQAKADGSFTVSTENLFH